jgi:hypothetical protein
MRKNLGRVLALFLIFSTTLFASSYRWKASANKLNVVTDEAVHLSYVCEFSDRAELFVIDFNPTTDNEKYTIILLSESQKIRDSKRINSYEFVAFVHKEGQTTFEFDVAMKTTNKDSIENSVLGRDNEEYEEYSVKYIKQKPLSLNVLASQSNIVGNLKMQIIADKPNIKAYTPYNFEVKVSGNGNLHKMKPLAFKIEGVKIFTEKPKKDFHLSADGYSGTWSQKFSFVSAKDFTIPPFFLTLYNLKNKKVEKLTSPKINLNVVNVYKKEQLIDKEEKHSEFNYSFLYYLLTFITGFLVAKVKIKLPQKEHPRTKILKEKIFQTKTLEELLIVLLLQNSNHFRELITQIERKEVLSLSDAKKRASRLIRN